MLDFKKWLKIREGDSHGPGELRFGAIGSRMWNTDKHLQIATTGGASVGMKKTMKKKMKKQAK